MRKQLCDALVARAKSPSMVFLTGDLGFMALEPLQAALGERFVNAGVAEQNMISVAAALAKQRLDVWVYSIAPFCYARPFEQIRNDIAFHRLPVRLIGNGGGYGYGVMGPTHHAIEDYGILLTLPNMRVYVPVFDEDVPFVVNKVGDNTQSTYLRLGRGEQPSTYVVPAYAPWRQLTAGDGVDVIAVGPLATTYIQAIENLPKSTRPNLWAVSELPLTLNPPPVELIARVSTTRQVCVAEEHVAHGSFASELAMYLLERGIAAKMTHLCARAHHYSKYGSQTYLRAQSGLDPQGLLNAIKTG
jgi:transketolase